jgi:hypothetical protein
MIWFDWKGKEREKKRREKERKNFLISSCKNSIQFDLITLNNVRTYFLPYTIGYDDADDDKILIRFF